MGAKWGTVSTIKAPVGAIIDFAAHHLDLGAHRIHIYLDDTNETAYNALKPHPKLRVTLCDDRFWSRQKSPRPAKHQSRQSANMMRAYRKADDVDWLAHIDVDEFLLPQRPLSDQLSALPPDCLTARMPPIEALAEANPQDGPTWFKACRATNAERRADSAALYPVFGPHLNGGFLSHVAGKIFVRTGIRDLKIRIHHAFLGEDTNPGQQVLNETELAHFHARDWQDWLSTYRYRHARGSYRAELKPARAHGLTLHELLATLEADEGLQGLRHFYEEVCLATPQHRERLAARELLRQYHLELAAKRARHFPDWDG